LGIIHAISHISSDATPADFQKKQLPGDMQCAQCVLFAALGSGLNGSPPSVALPPALRDTAVRPLFFKLLPRAFRAFDSRAPPALV
jgi:hypothetical protein